MNAPQRPRQPAALNPRVKRQRDVIVKKLEPIGEAGTVLGWRKRPYISVWIRADNRRVFLLPRKSTRLDLNGEYIVVKHSPLTLIPRRPLRHR